MKELSGSHKFLKVPWWRRLESRVIAALVLLGVLCVGASAYLVKLTVQYFDGIVDSTLATRTQTLSLVEPFYEQFVLSQKREYQARTRAIARELELPLASPEVVQQQLHRILAEEPDIVELRFQQVLGPTLYAERRAVYPEQDGLWIWVSGGTVPLSSAATLTTTFALSPHMDLQYQRLGQLRRESQWIAVGDHFVTREELEQATFRAIGAASAFMLMIAFIGGLLLARTTTRKVSELTSVMSRVALGDMKVRVRPLGRDELGQLGAAFNQMLDELHHAQQKLAYLQKLSAWQEMARRIAHEIKNPLTPIQLAVQQLKEKDPHLSQDFSHLLATSVEIVEDEIATLRRMVTSFSHFAKLPEAQLEPVSIHRLLDEFVRAYGHLTEHDSDRLEVIKPEQDIEIIGDRQLLKQCLVNIVENAVLSADEAQIRAVHVRISTQINANEGMLTVRIEDNGPGIDISRREQVFEPYESTRKQGTGLGLAIVKKIVLDHQGEIRIDDSQLGGAAFIVCVPMTMNNSRVESS